MRVKSPPGPWRSRRPSNVRSAQSLRCGHGLRTEPPQRRPCRASRRLHGRARPPRGGGLRRADGRVRRPALPPADHRGAQGRGPPRGLWNLFLPHATQWTDGLSNLDYAPLAEIMGRSPLASEACNCSAPDTGNMEILHHVRHPRAAGALAATAAGRRDPLGVRHDRAGRGLERRDQHRVLDPTRRRRLRHQRPQVVHLGCGQPPLHGDDPDGQDRPGGRPAPAAVDGARADGHAGGHQPPGDPGVRLPGPGGALRDHLRRRAGSGHQRARRRGRRVRDRPGPPRARPHPPLHAGARRRRAGAGADVPSG